MGTIKQFNIPTTGPNKALLRKVTRVDRREAPGVLFLGGPAHPAAPAAAGAASGLRVRNAMWKNAAKLIGSGDESTLGSGFAHSLAGSKGAAERTGKGGLHLIVSQAQTLASPNDGGGIQLDAALRKYMYDYRTDQWYISLWTRHTRATPSANYPTVDIGIAEIGAGSTSLDYVLSLATSSGMTRWQAPLGNGFWDGNAESAAGSAAGNALAPVLRWGAGAGKANPVQTGQWSRVGPSWGTYGGTFNAAVGAGVQNKLPSFVFYEMFIENLTKSGRTYQDARALDREAFTAAFALGGRYAGDTFTDPSTIP